MLRAGVKKSGYLVAGTTAWAQWSDAPSFVVGPLRSDVTSSSFVIIAQSSKAGTASLLVTSVAVADAPADALFDSSPEQVAISAGVSFEIPHSGEAGGELRKAWVQIKDSAGQRATAFVNVLVPHVGYEVTLLETLNPDPSRRITAIPDLEDYEVLSHGAIDGAGTVSLNADGSGDFSSTIIGFRVYAGNYTDGWGASGYQSVATTAIGIVSAQQGQQISVDVVSQSPFAVGFSGVQGQQAVVAVRTAPAPSISARHSQQAAMQAAARVSPAMVAQQRQQALFDARVSPKIAVDARQGQQSSVSVSVQSNVAATASHDSQAAVVVLARPRIAFSAQQGQQGGVDVVVPFRPVIAFEAAQGQQVVAGVSVGGRIAASCSHQQQSLISVETRAVVEAAGANGQQINVALPIFPAPIIDFSGQQGQQAEVAVRIAVVVDFSGVQAQQVEIDVLPSPASLLDIDPELISFGALDVLVSQPLGTKVVYLSRDNVAVVEVFYDGAPLDLEAVSVVELYLLGAGVPVINSNDAADIIQWDAGSNELRFRLGDVAVPPGIYPVSLVFYDFLHPSGQTIAGPGGPQLQMEFADDRAA